MKPKQFRLLSIVLILFLSVPLVVILLDVGIWDKPTSDQPRVSGAMEALTFWTRSRAYPQKDIPIDKHFKAFQKQKLQLKKAGQSLDDATTWRAMGPHNVPGRMISLAVNPQNDNTLYSGSASGGLWRTYSAKTGGNWERIHTGFPTLGVMAIAIDPTDSNKIFIGTGETYGYQRSYGGSVIRTTRGSYGIGILKTTDGGATWEKSLDWTFHQERGIQCIRINPQNPKSLFAATSEGIYKTVDAGNTWRNVLAVFMGEDIVIHSIDTNKVMVSCGNLESSGTGLYRSFNAGEDWTKIDSLPSFTGKALLDAYASDPDVVFASLADSVHRDFYAPWDADGIGLWRTEDFGTNWTAVHTRNIPQWQGWFSHWVAVHPVDFNQVVQAGVQIFKSNNGGNTLQLIGGPHVHHHDYTLDPFDPNVLYIACDGGVYRTDNFGDSYQNLGYGLQTGQFYNGFSSSSSDSNLAIGGFQDNGVNLFSGAIDGWDHVIGGDGCWTAINSINDNIIYGESQRNNISKSTNRGVSFAPATSGLADENVAFVAPFVISPSNPSILYSGRGRIYKTTNAADNWFPTNNNRPLDGNPALSIAISATNADIVYVGTAPIYSEAHIFRTTNGGDNWVNITRFLPDRYPMDIAVAPNDYKTVYVVFGGYGSGHVYKSTNAGEYWYDITGSLPDVPTLAVAIDPLNSDHVYVGNDLGVYASIDGGTTWETFNNGLPEAVIAMDLNISPSNRSLRVATHGNGVYQRSLLYKPAVYLVYNFESLPDAILLGTEVEFAANVINIGYETMIDTSTVKLRMVDETNNQIFSDIKTFSNLGSKESRQIVFDGKFVPQNSGDYVVQFIDLGWTSQPKADTTRQAMNVITPPTIASATVRKEYRPYEQISGGTILPFGDDGYASFDLPFVFSYDLWDYDRIQICSNGWCEFGTGPDGSVRGISVPDQIGGVGANENGRLAGTARPNKALGPWWEDLNPEATRNPGEVSFRTLGSEPDRVFVIQWKNMRAYFDAATTTRLNFQVRLYETSNIIEYHYGPLVRGTFVGSDLGAMIGFKDHIGGDFHFYDIAGKGIEPAGEIVTNLSPLTDWPGPDSCFVIQTLTTGISSDEPPRVPTEIVLYQNYPNPFNPTTTIQYDLPNSNKVILKIYNTLGQEVRTLVNDIQDAGRKSVVWDGMDNVGQPVSSGVYVYRLKIGNEVKVRKMVVVR